MQVHALASIFPPMTEDEFEELVESIRTNGQLQPIVKFEDQILDGANRYRACMALGKAPITSEFNGKNAFEYVISVNLHRRHLTSDQKAAIAATLAMTTEESNQRQDENRRLGPNGNVGDVSVITIRDAAKKLHVSDRKVSVARDVKEKAENDGVPEVFEAVRSGEKSLEEAAAELKVESFKQRMAKPFSRTTRHKEIEDVDPVPGSIGEAIGQQAPERPDVAQVLRELLLACLHIGSYSSTEVMAALTRDQTQETLKSIDATVEHLTDMATELRGSLSGGLRIVGAI